MGALLGVIVGLVALVMLVVIHEFGHAIVAKRCGVQIEEFGIGLPPKIWSKKLKNGIIFSINWLMLGGFVKLKGEYDEANQKGDYGAATFWQKTKILFAGVTANAMFAVVIITVLSLFGMPKLFDNQFIVNSDAKKVTMPVEIVNVASGSAAEKIGLKPGDIMTRFANEGVTSDEQLDKLIDKYKAKQVDISYIRNGKIINSKVLLGSDIDKGYLGISMGQREYTRSTWSAPIVGVVTTAQFSWETAKGVGQLISNLSGNFLGQFSSDAKVRNASTAKLKTVGDSVAGPVGIVGIIFPAAEKSGVTQIALLVAIISVSLAVMNVLPIPMLDGGRWFTMVIFRLFRKKLTMAREEKIQSFGFFVLMGLALIVTVLDVKKIL